MRDFVIYSVMLPADFDMKKLEKIRALLHRDAAIVEFHGFGHQKFSRRFWDDVGRWVGREFHRMLTE